MKPVKIADLKNRLSYYFRRVRRGESILVADRDKVIARIERVSGREVLPEADGSGWNASRGKGSSAAAPAALTGSGCERSLS
jgi:antitoxin (DNA-binding transcriptional repressor) of toxin-antitoxin stability system